MPAACQLTLPLVGVVPSTQFTLSDQARAEGLRTGGEPPLRAADSQGIAEADDHPIILSIGTSTRSWDEFVEALKAHGIEAVADVRSFPASRRFPHFWREEMEKRLPAAGIEYHYLGRDLGGYRRGGYEAHMLTEDFARGLDDLEPLARARRTAFFCAERMPWKCHRRHIGAALQERGWRVIHILDQKRTWEFTH